MADDGPAASPADGPLSRPGTNRYGLPPRIRARADFLRAARATTVRLPGFMLQARDRGDGADLRVGFTCSKKVGNAVARNRAKRRLREIARLELAELGRPGWDYVLIGRRDETATRDFARMRADLAGALAGLHG